MGFIPIKSFEQRAVFSMLRARLSFIKSRTAQANQVRGLLGEFGIVHIFKGLLDIIYDAEDGSTVIFQKLLLCLR
jgi:transposase